MTRNYHMLGKIYQINTIDSFEGEILHQELGIYPIAKQDDTIDITINYLEKLENKIPILKNPSIHLYYKDSFRWELINASIEFHFNNKQLIQIDFCIKQGGKIKAMANKWFSYQFTNRKESIGFIFHELVLIPSAFFSPDMSVVHASAIDDDGAILFGGTGGVGKTSLELELCNNHNKNFFADDIVVVNNKGVAFPNLSYPKIYGYNLVNNEDVRKKIFSQAGFFDKFHWQTRKSINPAIVRRRVNPVDLYGQISNQPKELKTLYILVKDGTVNQIEKSNIGKEEASKLNRLVLETEYHIFYKHLLWDEFNSMIASSAPRLNYADLTENIEQNFLSTLTNAESYIIKIPLHIKHNKFLEKMSDIVLSGSRT